MLIFSEVILKCLLWSKTEVHDSPTDLFDQDLLLFSRVKKIDIRIYNQSVGFPQVALSRLFGINDLQASGPCDCFSLCCVQRLKCVKIGRITHILWE